MKFKRQIISELPLHSLGIVIFTLLDLKPTIKSGMAHAWAMVIPIYIVNIIFFYVSAYYLIPMTQKKVRSFLIQLFCYLAYIFVYAYLIFVFIYFLYRIHHGDFRDWMTSHDYWNLISRSSLFFVLGLSLSTFLAKIKEKNDTIERERLLAESKRKNLEMENLLLRSQLNPHFINNGLFFIQNEANKNNPDMADWVGSFADVVDYHLNTSSNGPVPLDDDLDKIQNYICSQQRLLRDQIKIYFIREIDEVSGTILIYPLLFMSLVENMFKHGRLKAAEKSAVVIIHRDYEWLVYHSENEISATAPKVPKTGIGLTNTKRRLELLYPELHSFHTSITNNRFIVDVKIRLWKK